MFESLKKLFPDPNISEDELERYKVARGLYIEDPWERVKAIFSVDDFGNLHPDLARAWLVTQTGFCIGGGIGAINASVKETREFVRTNDTNVYMSKNEMYRLMSHRAFLAMSKGGFSWGPKIGVFAGTFALVSSCCEAYRNKPGIIEYVVGGYIAVGLSRSAFGIKGFIAGGIVGAVLGFIYGSLRVGVLKLTKSDDLTIKYAQYAYSKHRKELLMKLRGSSTSNSTDTLIIKVHGEHTPDPLDGFDAGDKNTEIKEEK